MSDHWLQAQDKTWQERKRNIDCKFSDGFSLKKNQTEEKNNFHKRKPDWM